MQSLLHMVTGDSRACCHELVKWRFVALMFISQSSWHDSTFILQPIVSSTQTGILSFFVQGFLHMLDGCYRSLSVFTLALSVGRLRALAVSSDYSVQSVCSSIMGFASSFILSNTYSWQFSLSGGYHLPTMMSALFMDLEVTFMFIVRHTTHVYIVSRHFGFWQYRIALLQGWLQCQLFSPWHPCFPLIINNIRASHQLLVYSFADCGYSCIAIIFSVKRHLNMPYISFDYKC